MEQPGAAEFWLWIATGGMVFGTVAFLYLATQARRDNFNHYVVAALVTLWAALNYVVMATGSGITQVTQADGTVRLFYAARYVDWALTTPLLLIGLALVAMGTLRRNATLVAALVVADLAMIFFGYLAGVNGGGGRYFWFLLSSVAFAAVLYLIWVPLRHEAQRSRAPESGNFQTLAILLSVLWLFYPVVWLFGTEGVGALTTSGEVFLYAVLDVAAKVAFGFVLLTGVRQAYGNQARRAAF